MSEVYWGIIGGLVALVLTLFVCLDLVYSNTKRTDHASSGGTDRPSRATDRPSSPERHAA